MMRKKNIFFNIIFSACFCIYAVSPLLFTYGYGKASGRNSAIVNLKLYAVDLVLSSLTHHKNDASMRHTVKVLFRKKGAALSSNSLDANDNPELYIGRAFNYDLSFEFPSTIAAQNQTFGFHESFCRFHSGLSPPSV